MKRKRNQVSTESAEEGATYSTNERGRNSSSSMAADVITMEGDLGPDIDEEDFNNENVDDLDSDHDESAGVNGEDDEPTDEQIDPSAVDDEDLDGPDPDDEIDDESDYMDQYKDTVWTNFEYEDPSLSGSSSNSSAPRTYPRFSEEPGRPINIPENCKDPLHFFRLFFTDTVMDDFVRATNSYGREKCPGFTPTNVAELNTLFAMILLMGLVRQPEMTSYWRKENKFLSDLYGRSIVSTHMSRNRFQQLIAYLHHLDLGNKTPSQRLEMKRNDPFYLVTPFLNFLSDRFAYYYRCSDFIDIDEMCIKFKGRHKCRFYNPNKPHKWHFKAFCLNDRNGYLHRFYMYRGKEDDRREKCPSSALPVRKLTAYPEYHNRNHLLSTDNWFTSLETLRICQRHNIHSVGTCRVNRRGIPASCCMKSKSKQSKKGTTKLAQALLKNNPIYFAGWVDRSPVHFLATFPPEKDSVNRKQSVDGDSVTVTSREAPSFAKLYNYGMKGTDVGDQLESYYSFEHRTRRWPRRIFAHFLLVTMNNAKLVYNSHFSKNISLRSFIEAIIKSLLPYSESEEVGQTSVEISESVEVSSGNSSTEHSKRYRRIRTWLAMKTERLTCSRLPVEHHALVQGKPVPIRGNCKVCLKSTSSQCELCESYLCIDYRDGTTCFENFHTKENFLEEYVTK